MKIKAEDLPGTSRLYHDYIHDFDKVSPFYQYDFSKEDAFKKQVERVKLRNYPRQALGAILSRQNKTFGAGERTFKSIECLANEGAHVIITGQQVGLFGGPLFVLYKALTAIKLADKLGRTCCKGFVPVFWLASDDADFAEVNHINFINNANALSQLHLNADSDQLPMSQVKLENEIETLITALDDGLHPSEFKDEIFEKIRASYQTGEPMSTAFGKWLMALLKDFGLIIVDPADPEFKKLMREAYAQEITEASPSTSAVLETSSALRKSGYHTQIQIKEGKYNLFYHDPARIGLEQHNGHIVTTDGNQDFDEADLLKKIEANPELFSPNVALRGPIQDAIFPTIAYVAGPSEAAYFAQLKGVYEAFDIPMPIIYPRKTATLIEPAIDRLLDKLDLKMTELWRPVDQIAGELSRRALSDAFTEKIESLKENLPKQLLDLREEIIAIDPSLEKMLENTSGRVIGSIENLEKKAAQAIRRKQQQQQNQLNRLSAALYPNQNLQERELNFVPFVTKYGMDFIEKVYENLEISSFDHQVIWL